MAMATTQQCLRHSRILIARFGSSWQIPGLEGLGVPLMPLRDLQAAEALVAGRGFFP